MPKKDDAFELEVRLAWSRSLSGAPWTLKRGGYTLDVRVQRQEKAESKGVVIEYSLSDEQGSDILAQRSQALAIEDKACNLGGSELMFKCPRCDGHRRALYFHPVASMEFACGRCSKLKTRNARERKKKSKLLFSEGETEGMVRRAPPPQDPLARVLFDLMDCDPEIGNAVLDTLKPFLTAKMQRVLVAIAEQIAKEQPVLEEGVRFAKQLLKETHGIDLDAENSSEA